MTNSAVKNLILLIPLLLVLSCSSYSVSVNDRVVYDPPGLFKDHSIKDESLKQCVIATIAENKLTKAEQLKKLYCPSGNIISLEGIETFSEIKQLGLAQNAIVSIKPIGSLKKLEHLDISDNQVREFLPLQALSQLKTLKASGNSRAKCSTLTNIKASEVTSLPKHCSGE